MTDRADDVKRLAAAELELLEAERELETAQALHEKQQAMRQAQLETNRALQEAGGEPQDVDPEPPPVPEKLWERVRQARISLEQTKQDVEAASQPSEPEPAPQNPEPAETPAPRTLPAQKGSRLPALLLVLFLTLFVLNLPIVFYALLYDRYPHLLTSIFYFGYFLFMAFGASKVCENFMPEESLEIVFGLQFMLCFLPGMMIGCYFASPFLKATFLQPISVRTPARDVQSSFSGYYKFRSAVVRGNLPGSASETHSTKSGDSTTRSTTTYHVAPLTAANWRPRQPVKLWIVRKGKDNGFQASADNYRGFAGLATRTTSTLLEAAENSAQLHDLKVDQDPVFMYELSGEDRLWYGRYMAISLLVLNVLVLGAATKATLR